MNLVPKNRRDKKILGPRRSYMIKEEIQVERLATFTEAEARTLDRFLDGGLVSGFIETRTSKLETKVNKLENRVKALLSKAVDGVFGEEGKDELPD